MVNLKIDGKTVEIEKGATILAAAEKVGIRIPTLCFLKKVSPTGACRICVVEIEGVDKPMAACHTQATDGMVVTTRSEKLHAIRKQIIELLLVNHPLDCPVCDAGGECDLQNITYEFNVTRQSFEAEDVNADTIDGWPLIQQVPSRCILCEKCVKTCHEVVGSSALFTNEKGDKAFIDKHLELCEYCGNCVQVCPTGTMISKTFKFRARPWELRKTSSVCTLCSGQCEVEVQTKGNEIYRIVAEDGCGSNDGNLCIGAFFSHGYVGSDKRLSSPLLKKDGLQVRIGWDEAMQMVVEQGRSAGGNACAGFGSPRLTNEENYLFQKLFRVGFGSNNLDSEARFGFLRGVETLREQLGLGGASNRYDRIGSASAVLVFGADVTAEAPLIDWQIERACRQGDGKLVLANMRRVKLARHSNTFLQYRPGSETVIAQAMTRLVLEKGQADQDFLDQYLEDSAALEQLKSVDIDRAAAAAGVERALLEEAADYLGSADSVAIVFGGDLLKGAQAEAASGALANLALVCGALHGDNGGLFPIEEKGNMQGVVDMGLSASLLPGQRSYADAAAFEQAWGAKLPQGGRDADGILAGIEQGEIRFLYLAGVNPLVDYPESARWRQALGKVEFLVVQDILSSELTEMADLVLPGTTFAEKNGTVTSHDGRLGYLQSALKPLGEARPDGRIFADVLAALTGREPLDESSLQAEIKNLSGLYEDVCFTGRGRRSCLKLPWRPQPKGLRLAQIEPGPVAEGMQLLAGSILFQFGSTTTYAPGPAEVAPAGYIEMNPEDVRAQGLKDGGKVRLTTAAGSVQGALRVSTDVPQGLVFAPVNFADVNVQQAIPAGSTYVAVEVAKG